MTLQETALLKLRQANKDYLSNQAKRLEKLLNKILGIKVKPTSDRITIDGLTFQLVVQHYKTDNGMTPKTMDTLYLVAPGTGRWDKGQRIYDWDDLGKYLYPNFNIYEEKPDETYYADLEKKISEIDIDKFMED